MYYIDTQTDTEALIVSIRHYEHIGNQRTKQLWCYSNTLPNSIGICPKHTQQYLAALTRAAYK